MHKDRGIKDRHGATAQLLEAAAAGASVAVAPANAIGRELTADVFGECDVPEAPCSRRDGYAVSGADTASASAKAPLQMPLAGLIPAEAVNPPSLAPGHAAPVLTGGPIPSGADAIVADEDVSFDSRHVSISSAIPAGQHVQPQGGDFPAGGRIGRAGDMVTPSMAAVMIRSRVREVTVKPVPTALVLTIGSELADPYDASATERMPADNVVLASGLLRQAGFQVVERTVIADDLTMLTQCLENAQTDLVVTTGGTGHSERDVARAGAAAAGFSPVFHGVDMRPGKGMFASCRGGSILLGLPGPPGAVFACLHAFLPALFAVMSGHEAPEPVMAALGERVVPRKRGDWLVPCTVHRSGMTRTAHPLLEKSQTPLQVLTAAQGAVIIPFGAELAAGDEVELLVLGS